MSGVLAGKAVIVTGAAMGMGRAYAHDIAREGGQVLVNDIDADGARTVVEEIVAAGHVAIAAPGSVADWDAAEQLVATAQAEFGRIDGLVNNAGLVWMGPTWEQPRSSIDALVQVNVLGALYVGAHVIRVMVEQGSGAIVNATSSAQMGIPHLATYGATKGALASLTYGWSLDLAERGVRVNAFAPSALTRMADPDLVPTAHLCDPSENAPVVTFLLSDLAAGVSGQVVQWRQGALCIVGHPSLTEHAVHRAAWDAEAVARELGPLLREHAQPTGWAPGS